MLLAVDLAENLIDEAGITICCMLSLNSSSVLGAEFDLPEADCLSTDSNAAFREQICAING